jgi:hypothetical protein
MKAGIYQFHESSVIQGVVEETKLGRF